MGVEMESVIFRIDGGSRFFRKAPGGLFFELNTYADDAAPHFQDTFEKS